ncbi:Phosphatidylinositide phosphatase SAC2 [Fasciolopsis buskii]|uniref:Phosphatidylinositide phosphatase SAC2 n=1 Tax=Fasciolopsis buskii TaxID=27845 RepID=A0A8E0RSA7_9TREM|nr:Phosphatidylinositide phosphatase SAC2 [Fasciolopsis buski]
MLYSYRRILYHYWLNTPLFLLFSFLSPSHFVSCAWAFWHAASAVLNEWNPVCLGTVDGVIGKIRYDPVQAFDQSTFRRVVRNTFWVSRNLFPPSKFIQIKVVSCTCPNISSFVFMYVCLQMLPCYPFSSVHLSRHSSRSQSTFTNQSILVFFVVLVLPNPDSCWRLFLIQNSEHVGHLPDGMEIRRVTRVIALPLSTQPTRDLNLKPCTKNHPESVKCTASGTSSNPQNPLIGNVRRRLRNAAGTADTKPVSKVACLPIV